MPINLSGYRFTIVDTSSLVISGPWGPHQEQMSPVFTFAWSMASMVNSSGISSVTLSIPIHLLKVANMGLLMKASVGCCIQASMICFSIAIISPFSKVGSNSCLNLMGKRISPRQYISLLCASDIPWVRVKRGISPLYSRSNRARGR